MGAGGVVAEQGLLAAEDAGNVGVLAGEVGVLAGDA